MTANEKLQDLLLERSLILERIKGSVSNDLTKVYDELLKNISKRINESDLTIKESERLIKLLEKDLVIPYAELGNDLNALAQDESKFMLNAVNAAAGIDIATTLPTNKTINKIANASLMEGATIKNWFGSLEQSLQFDVAREVRQSIIQGRTNREVTNSLKNILGTSLRRSQTLARTAVSTISNDARMQTINENEDIFKGYKWSATLDSRTRIEHFLLDGALWDLNKKGLNEKGKKYYFRTAPHGWNCRCILLPLIKSFREIGVDLDEIPDRTRASLDGSVPAEMTASEWFETKDKAFQKQYLGEGRYNLYKEGKITLSDLISKSGDPLTIKELTNIQTPKIVVPKNIVPKVPKIDFGYDGKFNKYVEDIRDEAKIVIDKLPKPKIDEALKSERPVYLISDKTVKTSASRSTFLHEYGHHIDYILKNDGKMPYSLKTLSEASTLDMIKTGAIDKDELQKYFNKWFVETPVYFEKGKNKGKLKGYLTDKPEGKEYYSRFSDIMDSLSGGVFHDKFYADGHGSRYYKNYDSKMTENFANLFDLWSQKTNWEETKTLFPNMTKDFENIMKEVIDGKFD